MSNLNSSGSQDRFPLAPGASRTFFTTQGSNHLQVEVKGDDQSVGSVLVKLQTSEDNVTFTDVNSATVVPCGVAFASGDVGKYCRVISVTGTDIVYIVCKSRNIAQVVPKL